MSDWLPPIETDGRSIEDILADMTQCLVDGWRREDLRLLAGTLSEPLYVGARRDDEGRAEPVMVQELRPGAVLYGVRVV